MIPLFTKTGRLLCRRLSLYIEAWKTLLWSGCFAFKKEPRMWCPPWLLYPFLFTVSFLWGRLNTKKGLLNAGEDQCELVKNPLYLCFKIPFCSVLQFYMQKGLSPVGGGVRWESVWLGVSVLLFWGGQSWSRSFCSWKRLGGEYLRSYRQIKNVISTFSLIATGVEGQGRLGGERKVTDLPRNIFDAHTSYLTPGSIPM